MVFKKEELLIIIDFGSQLTQLIARRLRELKVYCEIHPYNSISEDFLNERGAKGFILSGSPSSTIDKESPRVPISLYKLGVPILGICYGQQLMMTQLGGSIKRGANTAEFGKAYIQKVGPELSLLNGWFNEGREQVWMSHGDHVSKLPEDFKVFASSEKAPFAVVANTNQKMFAVQFHPEVYHTPKGIKLLDNFVKVCRFSKNWTMESYLEKTIKAIRAQVGKNKVICALSGGVDSSVTALLINKAIGNQLTCIFVDNGLLRKNEAIEVINMFKNAYKINFIHAKEQKLFLQSLKGETNPEKKRKIIGKLFIKVFEKYSQKSGNIKYLAQGTLYPDIIESVSFTGAPSETIKSHHNVGGLPKHMKMTLVEPLRELFKDEVRELGRELGLTESFIGRHPFPGPGLAIRCPGEVTRKKLTILREADHIFISQLRKYNLYNYIWQAYVALLPVKTVGVMGDSRTYDFACTLRAVNSVDGMTAEYYPFEHSFLSETATKIINEVKGINRVTYDITSKPPGTIEWE